MTIRIIFKSGAEFTIKCQKFTITKNSFGEMTGYDVKGITEGQPIFININEVAAIVRVLSDEKIGG